MSNVAIDGELARLVERLSKLRIATPIDDPNYDAITEQYKEASDRQTEAIGKAIDDADQNYLNFSKEIKVAITAINRALKDIQKIAQAIEQVAKVLEIVGKILGKLIGG